MNRLRKSLVCLISLAVMAVSSSPVEPTREIVPISELMRSPEAVVEPKFAHDESRHSDSETADKCAKCNQVVCTCNDTNL
ncbi:hypothetical protein MJO28_000529 [Puccinia striiformis f. sp. tritici]|uniref:Uncharacterized protein n=1 Tax=Puccinia striiformis f. sp. tritici TaxID=168172 RepID=A0ACC0EY63_9BASI|nr:hypothetical protein Pst134EA_000713 [Puccinia striiformis f. sp. tritici]KAH9466858.1 hypothetical protein Pst134EB_001910 [Puccinia striiformis f. sp. tritici]KAH9473631.1 hypothetical protein Pst134EA_000713 [Puccinia striiformis f. sp. tritici]KAI7962435.1 hypothetical protein MJO28_000529 [Puccinia striiformis f. sp. tritici]KAI7967422.1 hypothetical protein MJO29_000699 [Puccinia striiformis f. sp. tritici]